MNISSLAPNKYSWLLLAGTAGTAAVGFSFIGSGSQDPEYALNPQTSNSYTCFGKMFEGAKKPHPPESSSGNFDPKQEREWKIKGPTNNRKQDSVGCAWMGITGVRALNEDVDENEKHYIFDFDSEVVVKNESVGWSLSAESKVYKTQICDGDDCQKMVPFYVQTTQYILFLLEKESSGWVLRRGYSWYDPSLSLDNSHSIYIASPLGEWLSDDQVQLVIDDRFKNKIKEHKYLGIWSSKNSGRGEIFQEIKLGDATKTKFEILGRENPFGNPTGNEGYRKVYTSWNKDREWFRFTGEEVGNGGFVDISSILGEWYAPFRGLNGSWMGVAEYCSSSNKNQAICATQDKSKRK